MFLIHGVFFQQATILGLTGTGVVTRLEPNHPFLFTGKIISVKETPDSEEKWVGEVEDKFGKAILFDIKLTSEKLTFFKRYENDKGIIAYTLEFHEMEGYVGTYFSSSNCVEGFARCILYRVNDNFFKHEAISQILSVKA